MDISQKNNNLNMVHVVDILGCGLHGAVLMAFSMKASSAFLFFSLWVVE
jgi:hypothetical protein